MTPPPSQPPHSHSSKRKPRILLGVTGSVATVKIPQLALCLIEQLHVDVRIVLTHGAQYFWNSSVKTYDPISWERLMNKWKKCQETKHNFMGDIKDGDDSAEGELYLHGKIYIYIFIFTYIFVLTIFSRFSIHNELRN